MHLHEIIRRFHIKIKSSNFAKKTEELETLELHFRVATSAGSKDGLLPQTEQAILLFCHTPHLALFPYSLPILLIYFTP